MRRKTAATNYQHANDGEGLQLHPTRFCAVVTYCVGRMAISWNMSRRLSCDVFISINFLPLGAESSCASSLSKTPANRSLRRKAGFIEQRVFSRDERCQRLAQVAGVAAGRDR